MGWICYLTFVATMSQWIRISKHLRYLKYIVFICQSDLTKSGEKLLIPGFCSPSFNVTVSDLTIISASGGELLPQKVSKLNSRKSRLGHWIRTDFIEDVDLPGSDDYRATLPLRCSRPIFKQWYASSQLSERFQLRQGGKLGINETWWIMQSLQN